MKAKQWSDGTHFTQSQKDDIAQMVDEVGRS